MQTLKNRESNVDTDVDQGYSSARTSPNQTPSTSPRYQVSPDSSSSSSTRSSDHTYRNRAIPEPHRANSYSVLDLEDSNIVPNNDANLYRIPEALDMTCQKFDSNDPNGYRFVRSRRLVEDSLKMVEPSASRAVKRTAVDEKLELDCKKFRLTTQMSQVAL